MSFLDLIKNFLAPQGDKPQTTATAENQPAAEPSKPNQPVGNQNSGTISSRTEPQSQQQPQQPEPEPEPSANAHSSKKGGEEAASKPESSATAAEPSKPQPEQVSAPQVRHEVINGISQILQPLLGMDDFRGICIYTTNHIYAMALNQEFENQLRTQFDDRGFRSLGNGTVEVLEKQPSTSARDVYKGIIFADIIAKEANTVTQQKARITIFKGKGSLKQAEYLIDTLTDNKTVYNIGRGDTTTKNGIFRENDIVINDTETIPAIAELNSYVSSSHANIEAVKGKFYLKAMISGIANGNATKIIRGQEIVKLETDKTLYQLADGDIIELGRSVMLKFETL